MKSHLLFLINSVLLGVGLAMDAFSVSVADALSAPGMRARRRAAIAGTFAGFQFVMPLLGWLCVHGIERQFTRIQRFVPWIALVLLLYIGGKLLLEGVREQRRAGVGHADGEQFGSENTDGERSDSEQSGSEHTCGEQSDGERSDGEQSDDEHTCGEQSRGEQSGGECSDGEQSGGKPTCGEHTGAARLAAGDILLQGIATSIDALSVGFTIAEYGAARALLCAGIIAVVTLLICIAGLRLGRRIGTRIAGRASILGGVILIGIGVEIFVRGLLNV